MPSLTTNDTEHSDTTLSNLYVDQQGEKLSTNLSAEEYTDTDTRNFSTQNCSPNPDSSKIRVSGNIETPPKPTGNQGILSLQKTNVIRDHGNCSISLLCTSLKSKSMPPVTKAISEKVKSSLYFAENNDNIWAILEKIGCSTSLMKQELINSQQREQALALELQYLRHINGDQNDGSGDVLEQNPEQVISTTTASLKKIENKINKSKQPKRILEVDALQAVMFSLQEENLSSVHQVNGGSDCWCLLWDGHTGKLKPEDAKEENKKSEFSSKDGCVCPWHLKVISTLIKVKLVLLDHLQQLHKEKEEQLQMTNQRLKKFKDQNVYEGSTANKECAMKSQQLENYLQGFHYSKVSDQELQKENKELKTEIKQLGITVQSLTYDNSKYKEIINTLTEEKNIMHTQLIKINEDSKGYVNELKTLLKKFEDLTKQKRELQEESSQICIQNEHMTQALSDLRSENQKLQEEMSALIIERDRLMHQLESIQKHSSQLEKETQILQLKINQLYKEKSSLENQLQKYKLQIQQPKNKETDLKFEQKAPLQLPREAKNNKVNLETVFQESDNAKTALKKEFQQIRSDSSFSEEKLHCELKEARAKNEILETGLLDMIRECQILSTLASGLRGENKILKAELQKHMEENLKSKLQVKRLNEEHKLFENYLQTVENERDVLQFEVEHLHRDYIKLTDQLTGQLGKQCKSNWAYGDQKTTSRPSSEKKYSTESSENLKGTSHYRHNTLACSSEEKSKIDEIRRKVEEEELRIVQRHKNAAEHYHAVSVSCTTGTSVINESRSNSSIRTVREEHIAQVAVVPQNELSVVHSTHHADNSKTAKQQ